MVDAYYTCACTIAGSDSGGGAGIQADLKTFAALGVWGCSVLTAITAQNTMEVTASLPVPTGMIRSQMEAVFADFPVAACKTGMLATAECVAAVADTFPSPEVQLVVDPVMVATSGTPLLDAAGEQALVELLLPRAALVTPNIAEACLLTGRSAITTKRTMEEAAEELLATGAGAVLLKGGHMKGKTVMDVLLADGEFSVLKGKRYPYEVHGSGCCLSAAITARLAMGETVPEACAGAKTFIDSAIQNAVPSLSGRRSVNPSFRDIRVGGK
ncbi:hypothetical protein AZH53_02995 [Methanomicrobiaceae archaeon CYW5]|uniref:bifunctional hydroxymethylpyrimidine kinase/phosphomethylpyrimidine kinase n=1 Tax=Methanovulcanius yangii TaxID=1789227 RepID=UPI0029C9C269|nr:bifunctional hydroxymethylpyrimidine kinase/phosphomethylpyrimidine kinase [Methanovulcanius yangii]MBT8507397.1 hypothetical protein [Methanovulcanius yangii]